MQDEKQTQHEAINYVHFQVTTLSNNVEERSDTQHTTT